MTTTTTTSTGASAAGTSSAAPPPARHRRKVEGVYYVFLLPSLIIFTLAITVPAVIGIFFSFTNSIGFGDWNFIGVTNYVAMFSDPAIVSSYLFTFGFAAVSVLLVNAIAFLLAVALTAKIRLKTGLRAIYVIPMVVSGIIIAYVFNFLFSNSLPEFGQAIGAGWLGESILANPDLAWVAIVVVTVWQAVPGTLLIYIAGILSIPGEVYEAADIDGASKTRQLLFITLPLVAGYVVINVILSFKNFLNAYDIIVGLTNGGPGTATRSIAMTIFTGFSGGDYAYQMANATLFFVIVVAISALQLWLSRGRNES